MPIHCGCVTRLEATGDRVRVWVQITPLYAAELYGWRSFQTALCERSLRKGFPIRVETMDTRYGQKIVGVERVREVA